MQWQNPYARGWQNPHEGQSAVGDPHGPCLRRELPRNPVAPSGLGSYKRTPLQEYMRQRKGGGHTNVGITINSMTTTLV